MTADLAPLPAALRTRVCDLFGVRHLIVQTGVRYVSDAGLTAATAQARTDRPFGVNAPMLYRAALPEGRPAAAR